MTPVKKVIQYGDHAVTLESGAIARQASGAVMVSMGDTTVMVTVVGKKEADEGRDFFPLTVNYQERTYAAGKIPGGFFKREGRPSEKETLTSRLIDRPMRPLFPKGFTNEVQIIATVVSLDKEIDPDIPAIIGASAATVIAGLPFSGPIGAARVGYQDGTFILNPTRSQLTGSQLDLVVAGTENAVLMVESEASELSEEVMLDAVLFGHQQQQVIIQAIREFAEELGTVYWDWQAPAADEALTAAVESQAAEQVTAAYQIQEKMARQERVAEIRAKTVALLTDEVDAEWDAETVKAAFGKLEKKIVRSRILTGEPRIDGRDTRTVRALDIKVGVLPRAHGSAVFTRGETQALVATTLGTERDAQIIDAIEGERKEPFMFHYNFPPSCVGETGFVGSPKRREIGHGRLAKRGVAAMMPGMRDVRRIACARAASASF